MPFGLPFRRNRGPLPYAETTDAEYARLVARTFTTAETRPGTLILSGPCPRCSAPIDIPVVTEVFRARRSRSGGSGGGSGDGPRVEPMACTCDEEHPARPEGVQGCGAYWTLLVPSPR
ncbi:hypothetical protein [Actinomadura roseirufa]|uniref:hypothetical protein n=1 Tax=Actinomadura roseirufa TaxID=2094049 RepID=UPI001040F1FA|nr:hypothetical protein [Actinomadura roseirufa]